MMQRIKVIVLLVRDLSAMHDSSRVHGSILWSANLLETLARVPGMDFVIVSICPGTASVANHEFARTLGFDHVFVPFRQASASTGNRRWQRVIAVFSSMWDALLEKYYFLAERYYGEQKHVDDVVMEIIREKQPDLIVINEVYPAFCVPSVFFLDIPRCLISVNNEIPFHRTTKAQGGLPGEKIHQKIARWIFRRGNWIPNARFRMYMNSVYKQCAGIVSLTHEDLPANLPNHVVQASIPPILKESALQWSYQGSRCVFFVGHIWIYSNRLAVEWICSHFARTLGEVDDKVRINIIGATADQVPAIWRRPNIHFMGSADKEEVSRQMTTADLFIAPIANKFGAKLKVAECVSHATPFLATCAAMSGLPFRESMPEIELNRPDAAARLVVEYMNNPGILTNLSQLIARCARRARIDQAEAWSTFLRRSVKTVSEQHAANIQAVRPAEPSQQKDHADAVGHRAKRSAL